MSVLVLMDTSLGAEAGRVLAGALNGNHVLTDLNIASNTLGKDINGHSDMSGVIALANTIKDMEAIISVDLTKNDIAFTETLFDLLANQSTKKQPVKIVCKEGNTWAPGTGKEQTLLELMFDKDILSSQETKKLELQERGLQGAVLERNPV
jgi:hypothetical protein